MRDLCLHASSGEKEDGLRGSARREEKENDEGTTSIGLNVVWETDEKGKSRKGEEGGEQETKMMEEAEERKGYRLISSSHVRTTPSSNGGQQVSKRASSLRNAHARARMIPKFTRGDT